MADAMFIHLQAGGVCDLRFVVVRATKSWKIFQC